MPPERTSLSVPHPDAWLEHYFWPKVDRSGACWLWTAGKADGYGRVLLPGSLGQMPAHRVAYEALIGAIPPGLDLHHECETRACVNPAHLRPLTRAQHVAQHGPQFAYSRKPLPATCRKGHPYDDENTYHRPNGRRACRSCRREAGRRHDSKRRAT